MRGLFALALVGFAFALQYSSVSLGSIDGYFHIRYSEIVREAGWQGFPPDFPWLPLTILAPEHYYDHHMLFHVGLAAFTGSDLIDGAKLAAAIGAAVAFLAVYFLLVRFEVHRRELWMIAILAAAPGFLYRMEMPRVQSWSLALLTLALGLLLTSRWRGLAPLALVYTWLYDAFPLLLAMCAAAVLAHLLLYRRLILAPLLCASFGVFLGSVVNPYFPDNLVFIVHHWAAKLSMPEGIQVGAEWDPLPVAEWLGWAGCAAVLTAGGLIAYRHRRRLDAPLLTALLVAALFFVLLWKSSRFMEYAVPFIGIALALALHERIDDALGTLSRRGRAAVAFLLLAWLAVSAVFAVRQLQGRPPPERYRGASKWIASATAPGALVFTSDWDDFPLLYFHNVRNRYLVGLDPTYLALHDPERFALWEEIRHGRNDHPAAAIRRAFDAPVAFTDHHHAAFIAAMDADPAAERAYEDDDGIVYRIGAPSS